MSAHVLVVDDEPAMVDLLAAVLRRKGYAVTAAASAAQALARLEDTPVDLVLTDINLGGTSGIALCAEASARRPDVPVVVLTGFGSMETAVAAMRAGAYDFVTKPIENEVLLRAIARAAEHRRVREELRALRREVAARDRRGAPTGESAAIRRVNELVARVADSDATVLLTGESGTGKELYARELHLRGRRRDGPFVAINCAAVPEALLESELFGHVKGAFTDARAARRGLFFQADGGTLLLDEVGELPLGLQAKLLRALQERAVRPVGGDLEQPFDARVVAATNRDLETAVEERRFREDLFYRLNVIAIELPPLRARGGDVLLLAQEFLRVYAERAGRPVKGISEEAARRMLAYAWPGNVRELQNAMERAVALARDDEVQVGDLPDKVQAFRPAHVVVASDDTTDLVPLEEVERRYILRVLEAVGGNKTLAARTLGLDRKTLYRKLEAWGVGA